MTAVSLDAVEREELCNLMDKLGPQAPTLLQPWTTQDLVAHLVIRTITAPHQVWWCPERGAGLQNAAERRSLKRTTPPFLQQFDRDRLSGCFASGGCTALRTSTSSSFTTRMCAEPTVLIHEQLTPH
jgi:hypothetical protein